MNDPTTVVYVDRLDEGGKLEADIYTPDGAVKFVAAAIPGDGFATGIKEWEAGVARHLQGLGGLVICPNYRGAPTYPWPAGRSDINEACRYIQDNEGAEFVAAGLPFVVMGTSAGGTYAVLAAEWLQKAKYRVDIVVAWSMLADFDAARDMSQLSDLLTGGQGTPTQEQLDDASPIKNLHKITDRKQEVDFLLACGANENPGIPARHTVAMKAALDAAGLYAEAYELPGGEHGTKLMNTGTPTGWQVTEPFLATRV